MEMTQTVSAAPVTVVNGPEDDVPVWFQIDWDQTEEDVRRLRQRIFAASQAAATRPIQPHPDRTTALTGFSHRYNT